MAGGGKHSHPPGGRVLPLRAIMLYPETTLEIQVLVLNGLPFIPYREFLLRGSFALGELMLLPETF